MSRSSRNSTIHSTTAALALALAGCGGGEPIATIAPEPLPEVTEEVPVTAAAPDSETPLRDRWLAPFAVSSVGEAAPRERRGVTVIGADPVIAAGRDAIEDTESGPAADPRAPSSTRPSGRVPTADGATTVERGAGNRPAISPPSATTTPPPSARSPTRDDGGFADRASPSTSRPSSAPSPAPRGPSTYIVEVGDSWIGIARDFGVSYSVLMDSNPGVDPERIRIGQILRIPPTGSESVTVRAGSRSYEVRPGDSLWGIARRFNVSADLIREANDLPDDRVRIGEVLIIPVEEGDDR